MKKLIAVLLTVTTAAGFAPAARAELNIAVLNAERAVLESEQARRMVQSLEQELEEDQQFIESVTAEIAELQERFQKDADVLTDAQRRQMTKEMEDKGLERRQRMEKVQKAIADRRQEIFQEISPLLQVVVQELIDVENYDLILPRSVTVPTQQGAYPIQPILYVNPRHDITAKVTERLNEKREDQERRR